MEPKESMTEQVVQLNPLFARSADLKSAVSPICNRHTVAQFNAPQRANSVQDAILQDTILRYSRLQICATLTIYLACFVFAPPGGAQTETVTAQYFEGSLRPLLNEYCLKCHSTEKHKVDLDLERFSSVTEVKKHPKVWQAMAEQLANNEMPPKEKPQPTAAQREQLLTWANAVLDDIALARAGDPGPVVLRRLSNAEYTYT